MKLDQLKTDKILRGPIFPEPGQVIIAVPMGEAVKLVGKGVKTGNRGFDLVSRKPHPEDPKTAIDVRFIEVKGGSDTGDIVLRASEYNTAKRLCKDLWLYVVFYCAPICRQAGQEPLLNILHDSATLEWQPIVKIGHYRLRQDSVKHPVELREEPPEYQTN
jgi:Protein NO VEIN, C-terminal